MSKTYIRINRQPLQQIVLVTRYVPIETPNRHLKVLCLFTYTKINSKWTNGLNIRPEMLKLPEETMGKTDIGSDKNFLKNAQTAQKIIPRINKWTYMMLKSFCKVHHKQSTEMIHRMEESLCQLYIRWWRATVFNTNCKN